MPTLPYCLREIVAKDFHTETIDNKTLRLTEPKEKLSVDIKFEKTDSVFCFSIDKERDKNKSKGDSVFPFLNPEVKDLCIKNDFILVYQKGVNIQVFLIELKSTNTGGYLKQLLAGKIFFQFVFERIKLCKSDFSGIYKDDLHYKGILFRKPREIPDKQTSSRKHLDFTETDHLPVTHQTYDKVYYLSQFV